jgi:hypothetical protein
VRAALAKQQACCERAFEVKVPTVPRGFRSLLVASEDARAEQQSAKDTGRVDRGLELVTDVMKHNTAFWSEVKDHA